ncbi:MAG TPA: RsmD family RNA methyltransferase, partial [Bacillota bacterium]|nr:RsmD family RNA methyltransferase [Bacillota bacterium]
MLRIVSGKYGGRYIKTLSEYNTRPTSNRIKESLFNIIQSKIP